MYVGVCLEEHWGFSLSIFSLTPCSYYKTELNWLKMLFIEISFFFLSQWMSLQNSLWTSIISLRQTFYCNINLLESTTLVLHMVFKQKYNMSCPFMFQLHIPSGSKLLYCGRLSFLRSIQINEPKLYLISCQNDARIRLGNE